ncbi:accessory gene regulator B family protein [Anaerosacchariphilus polymeriproducens]|uniref:Accessory regulator AgrB n=1 Tax=Anaerosacchariphilus polymeriproducens TaxID=1812858 RepID=A0A371AY10_9FIRM|nr:accessory gene regulator B family protein [Anaerosacchariphilus polymeriproducens]RDU24466.1 accessory regulator AgrB [Anaerosacchariphilus polymeriproducens]
MEKVFNRFLQKQILYGNITEEDKEIYYFGLKQTVIFFINVITSIIVGLLMKSVLEAIIILLFFIPLRCSAGGYHTRHRTSCYILSTLMVAGMIWGAKESSWSVISMVLISIICGTIIWMLCPVEDENKPLCELECKVYRKRTRVILLLEMLFMILMSVFLENKSIILAIEFVFIGLTVSLVLGKLKNVFNSKKNNEES